LPIDDESIVFVIKPTGYTLPVDEDMLPRFYYIHQPAGSSSCLKLRYRGIDPSGPLPDSVDFPLKKADEPRKFDVIVFTDPQPESQVEIDFIRDDVVHGRSISHSISRSGVLSAHDRGDNGGDVYVPHARSYASGAVLVHKHYSAMIQRNGFQTGGGNHASPYSRNLCRCGRDLFQRARHCIGADSNNSKRRSSFSRTFDPRHFNCHELHDVLQLAVGELPNKLRPSNTAAGPG
jgi:hypothetical protein